ncbi:MAG: hypothetical protein ACYTFG_12280, partial [Planctomycetota bacterium]
MNTKPIRALSAVLLLALAPGTCGCLTARVLLQPDMKYDFENPVDGLSVVCESALLGPVGGGAMGYGIFHGGPDEGRFGDTALVTGSVVGSILLPVLDFLLARWLVPRAFEDSKP